MDLYGLPQTLQQSNRNTRKTPFLLGVTRYAATTRVTVPQGYRILKLPKPKSGKTKAAQYSFSYQKLDDTHFVAKRNFETLLDILTPTQYVPYKTLADEILLALKDNILLEKVN